MFYSHEILASPKWGVATIWLVATVGPKSQARKITRKAIQDVNVPKACETILEPPGAPIALRLQGNLLYGVSRVYQQQCSYMLVDAEKIQRDIRTYFVAVDHGNISLAPGAAKGSHNQLLLLDDPDFDLDIPMPKLSLDQDGNVIFSHSARDSVKAFSSQASLSQLSPFGGSKDTSALSQASAHSLLIGEFDAATPSPANFPFELPFGQGSRVSSGSGSVRTRAYLSRQRPDMPLDEASWHEMPLSQLESFRMSQGKKESPGSDVSRVRITIDPSPLGSLQLGNENDLMAVDASLPAFEDWGIEFDADGNIVPPRDIAQTAEISAPGAARGVDTAKVGDGPNPVMDGEGNVIMTLGEEPLPDAEAFPRRQLPTTAEEPAETVVTSVAALASSNRAAGKRKVWTLDDETKVNSKVYKSWTENYLSISGRSLPIIRTTPAQARVNAAQLVYGFGIGNVGKPTGIPGLVHPLADMFAGDALLNQFIIPGGGGARRARSRESTEEFDLDKIEREVQDMERKRRRGSEEIARDNAEEDVEDEESRKRQRLEEGVQKAGRDAQAHIHGQQPSQPEGEPETIGEEVEIGRRASTALTELPLVPWSRQPGSSAQSKENTRGISHVESQPSPLAGRGSTLPDIERYSDQPVFGSDDVHQQVLPTQNSSLGLSNSPSIAFDPGRLARPQHAEDHHIAQAVRDNTEDGGDFLTFAENVAIEKGTSRDGEEGRLWLEFETLLEPDETSKAVAAQAFYQVLLLATKDTIKVEQAGQKTKPFGTIYMGFDFGRVDTDESETE